MDSCILDPFYPFPSRYISATFGDEIPWATYSQSITTIPLSRPSSVMTGRWRKCQISKTGTNQLLLGNTQLRLKEALALIDENKESTKKTERPLMWN